MLRKVLSEWTNEFIEHCDKIAGRKLDDAEVMMVIDYAIGFLRTDEMENYADQALMHLGITD